MREEPLISTQSLTPACLQPRYALLNAIANQLRYPNAHTLFCSRLLLGAFLDGAGSPSVAVAEVVREQLTRVLLERLIVHRPHPWGLLVTFIELIKAPTYGFWGHAFTRLNPDIERLFEVRAVRLWESHCRLPAPSISL